MKPEVIAGISFVVLVAFWLACAEILEWARLNEKLWRSDLRVDIEDAGGTYIISKHGVYSANGVPGMCGTNSSGNRGC